jgi:uncharacterized membrane protein
MVGEGYWTWAEASPAWRTIPLVNYLGWFATACITSFVALKILGVPPRVRTLPRSVYATLAVLSTIGFVFFFDDITVALVGGVAMGAGVVWSYVAPRRSTT